jgi:hypothetical protein
MYMYTIQATHRLPVLPNNCRWTHDRMQQIGRIMVPYPKSLQLRYSYVGLTEILTHFFTLWNKCKSLSAMSMYILLKWHDYLNVNLYTYIEMTAVYTTAMCKTSRVFVYTNGSLYMAQVFQLSNIFLNFRSRRMSISTGIDITIVCCWINSYGKLTK